jgi:peptide/nickel transport system permease protein
MLPTMRSGRKAIEQVFAEFQSVENATPGWLEDPRSGSRLAVDVLYPELGIAIQFRDHPAERASHELLADLCRQAGAWLVTLDPQAEIPARTLFDLRTALSSVARRVAQWEGPPEVKLRIMPRIASAKATCQQLLDGPSPLLKALARPSPEHRGRRRQMLDAVNWRRLRSSWRTFAESHIAVFGLALIGLFGIMSLAHPILRATVWQKGYYHPVTGYDMELMHPAPPSSRHLLGTDSLGRDVLSMLLSATRPTFVVGIAAALSTAVIATAIGVVSAYYRGAVDGILTHLSDAFLLLPAPILMVIIGMRFREIGPTPLGLIYGLVAGAGGAAIVMRSHALTIMNRPFIEAARIAGGGGRHIMVRHVLPHMLPLAALYMMLAVTGAVVADGFISFWGFSRSYLNWGTIIYSSFVYSTVLASGVEWHVLIPPSMALSLFAAAFYFVSRGLHRLADPRLRTR